ncbi:MAG: Rha family transcriptional regulator [Mesorhizobium sp.]
MIPMNAAPTMSSREIAELLEVRHDSVKRTIERLADRGVIDLPPMVEYLDNLGRKAGEYRIGKRDSYVIVAQLSPEFTARLVDRWQELEAGQQRALTPAEMFLQSAQVMAELERRQFEHEARFVAIDSKVEKIEAAQSVLSARPANAEAMTHLRKRVGKMFGLSAKIIDEVMRQSPYAPKPAGMVRNEHVDADGSTYAVYWKKDVTATFERFASESEAVSPIFYTHPFIRGRFRLARSHA